MEALDKFLLPIVLGFIAALPGLLGYILQGKKDKADLTSKFQEIAAKEATRMQSKVDEAKLLEDEISKCKRKERRVKYIVLEWQGGIDILSTQIKDAGETPKWIPAKKDVEEIERIFGDFGEE